MKKIFAVLFMMVISTVAYSAVNIWHVKAFEQDGRTIDVKAFYDKKPGALYLVKALAEQDVEGHKILDIKVLDGNEDVYAHVKAINSQQDKPQDVKAIDDSDQKMHIKAVTSDGELLDIKAFATKNSSVRDVKAIDSEGNLLAIKAISPKGEVYDIKSLNLSAGELEFALGEQASTMPVKAVP